MCIYYLVQLKEKLVQAFIHLGHKVNTMNLTFAKKLGFSVQKTKFGLLKIDDSSFKTFRIVIIFFLINDKADRSRFFKEIFLIADISMNIALIMLFFTLSNAEINFLERKLN